MIRPLRRCWRRPVLVPLAALAAGACTARPIELPRVGDCAAFSDTTLTYGEIGIGTCLAGPTDARFLATPQGTFLYVVNSDPFRTFASGSVLVLDADTLTRAGEATVDSLAVAALPIEKYAGRFALSPRFPSVGLLPGRLSDDSFLEADDDRVWLLDLSDPTAPTYADPSFLPVRADPYAVAIDDRSGRAFVANASDLSLSVIDLTGPAPTVFDPAPAARLDVSALDGVGNADLLATLPPSPSISTRERYTVTHVPDTARLWAPGTAGYTRFVRGSDTWTASGFGAEVSPTRLSVPEVVDPVLTTVADGAALGLIFSDGTSLRTAATDGTAGSWFLDASVPLRGATGGWLARLAGPSPVVIDGAARMLFDARPDGSEASVIGLATSIDGITYTARPDPVLLPPPGVDALAQPSAMVDPHLGAVRVWMSQRDGAGWSIAHAISSDAGTTWSSPEVVLDAPDADLGAPLVVAVAGGYRMWASRGDAAGWSIVTATSVDGLVWTDPEPALDLDLGPGGDRPPRAAVQPDRAGGWRVSAERLGPYGELAVPGVEWPDTIVGPGFTLRVASGHIAGPDTVARAEGGLLPGSLVDVSGLPTLYATVVDADRRPRLAALRQVGARWVVTADDLIPDGAGGNVTGALSPVVTALADGSWLMVYAAQDAAGIRRMRRATSPNGLAWTVQPGEILGGADTVGGWAGTAREPGALRVVDGALELWFSGSDGARWRIGVARSQDSGATWTFVPGTRDPWVFGEGEPGAFDDTSVRDPSLRVAPDGTVTLWYAANDGERWTIGRATRQGAAAWTRYTAPATRRTAPVLSAIDGTFAAREVRRPLAATVDGRSVLLHAGSDGATWRLGEAHDTALGVFPAHRAAVPGDTFTLETFRGTRGRSQIRLAQIVDGVPLPGANRDAVARDGPTALALDDARGILWVASKDFAGLIGVDVRDDSTATFEDRNALDIEVVLRLDSVSGATGIHDLVVDGDRIYASLREPDGIVILDVSEIDDAEVARVIDGTARAVLPMRDRTDDRGEETFATVGGAGLARVPGTSLLLVTHLRDNSLSVIDLARGAWGEEIRYLPDLAENPHLVRVDPTGEFAVVVGYLSGDVVRGDSERLVIIDLRADRDTYLQPIARITNR